MDTRDILLKLRIELDNAITYGSKKRAREIARQGLVLARSRQVPGEIEYFLAQQHIVKDEFASAIVHLDKAIACNPRDGAAFNDRALCMCELGIIDEALRYFDKGIEAEPDYATVYHNKGWLLNHIGRHTEAIKCFHTALTLDPARAVTYDNLADAQRSLGNYAAAVESYRKVLTLLTPGSCREIRTQITKEIMVLEQKLRYRACDTNNQ